MLVCRARLIPRLKQWVCAARVFIIFYTEHQLSAQKEEALYDKSLFFDKMMVHLDLSTIIYIILLDK